MSARITYPDRGRGPFPANGAGGTLSADGTKPGRYYTVNKGDQKMIGLVAFRADRDGAAVSINDYATWRGTAGIQRALGVAPDGLLGPKTVAALVSWQRNHGLTPDGVAGPATLKRMFVPVARKAAHAVNSKYDVLPDLVVGHVGYESGWDVGAVGSITPVDLGLGQINGPSHPDLTVNMRLDPDAALGFVAALVDANLDAFTGHVRDAVAAYNLGVGGAKSWIAAGRPDVWTRTANGRTVTTYVRRYIDRVLALAN